MAKPSHNTAAANGPRNEIDEDEAALVAARAEFESAEGEKVATSSFAPYIKPHVGGIYRFTPLFIDAANPEFIRNVCRWEGDKPLMAATGPVDSPEAVEVKKGELFTFSDYKGIDFEGLNGLNAIAMCTEMKKLGPLPNGKPRSPMFVFETKLSADDAKRFTARKADRLHQFQEAKRLSEAKEAADRVNGLPVTPSTGTTQHQLRS